MVVKETNMLLHSRPWCGIHLFLKHPLILLDTSRAHNNLKCDSHSESTLFINQHTHTHTLEAQHTTPTPPALQLSHGTTTLPSVRRRRERVSRLQYSYASGTRYDSAAYTFSYTSKPSKMSVTFSPLIPGWMRHCAPMTMLSQRQGTTASWNARFRCGCSFSEAI